MSRPVCACASGDAAVPRGGEAAVASGWDAMMRGGGVTFSGCAHGVAARARLQGAAKRRPPQSEQRRGVGWWGGKSDAQGGFLPTLGCVRVSNRPRGLPSVWLPPGSAALERAACRGGPSPAHALPLQRAS